CLSWHFLCVCFFFFSSRRRHTSFSRDWSSDVCSSDLRIVFRRAFRDVVAARIAEGVREGTLPAQHAPLTAAAIVGAVAEVMIGRSEERRVGKEWRSRW